ncbi:NAD(P)/FAD-dependent oxidoreductase [Auraticoccus sp. F435]|uniref:NAD(P)/FAD-dependent oxidoreductase n=1 Tax=Auraticoccus cholistanensis TaxID=2656650 RepID=A0A6A9V281_9ACTN|nr:FAD/NAD(P)-binding oxidoreductase [Auraticoccus cholistanensis]MVA77715.1 NAD(P)/FAD-dependent oxidoreductase [Auraticoccus cholistanensis]
MAPAPVDRSHDVLVVGGGNGGISTAALLLRRGCPDVGLVDPSETHWYKPLQNYVGGGLCDLDELRRPQASVVPPDVHWHRTAAVAVDPAAQVVTCADGTRIGYGDLVLSPGGQHDWSQVPGAGEAVTDGRAVSTYVGERAPEVWRQVQALRSGTAVFTIHAGPSSGRETVLKPMFMACDHWRSAGVLDDIDVVLVCDTGRIHPVARIEQEIRTHLAGYGITVREHTAVVAVEDRVVVLESPDGPERLPFDLLHLLPPYRAPAFLADSGLDAEGTRGYAAVDPETLQHPAHGRIWCIGDGADLGTARTGGGLRRQVAVVVENIRRSRRGEELQRYDGYTVGPITTSRSRLSLGEYDRTDRLTPSIPLVDTVRSRRVWWVVDRYLLPWTYWHRILKGRV